ncbi:MAG: hypothetical protein ACTSU5_11765 [Promethearchaeota archaeon]
MNPKKSISIDARLFEKLARFKGSISSSRHVTWNEAIERLLEMVDDLAEIRGEFERLRGLIEEMARRPVFVANGPQAAPVPPFPPTPRPPASILPSASSPPGVPPPSPPARAVHPAPPKAVSPKPGDEVHEALIQELHQKFKTAKSGLKSAKDAVARESEERKRALRAKAEREVGALKGDIEKVGLDYESVLQVVMAVKNIDSEKEKTDKIIHQSVMSLEAIFRLLGESREELQSEAESLKLGFRQNPDLILAELEGKREEKLDLNGESVTREEFISQKRESIFSLVQDQVNAIKTKLDSMGKRNRKKIPN